MNKASIKFLEDMAREFDALETLEDLECWANCYKAENFLRIVKEIRQQNEYIENLERWLVQAGYKKICSDCDLAGIPIWGKHKSECCGLCEEHVNENV